MKEDIDNLIELHKDNKGIKKYIMVLSLREFKNLQKLLSEEYSIKEKQVPASLWRHADEDGKTPYREGTVKFKGFELNVYCHTNIVGGYVISKMNDLPLVYMDIFKNSSKD